MREELDLILSVGGDWSAELDRVMVKLGEVETVAEAVEDIRIDVDVHDRQLDALMGKMSAAQAQGLGGVSVGSRGSVPPPTADVDVPDGIDFRRVRTAQLGRIIKDMDNDFGNLAKSMGNTMSAADKAADTFSLSNLRMSDFHNAVARIIPLLLVFIGALPALIAGVISLAAAAASATAALIGLAGLGAIGFAAQVGDGDISAGFQEIAAEVKDDFLDAFMPLAQDLAPVFERGLDGLEAFFDALAARGDVLRAFADVATDFGEFLLSYLPEAIANMGRLATAASGVFGEIAGALQDISFTQGFADFLAASLPTLRAFGAAMVNFLPTLAKISIGFLDVVNGVMALIGVVGTILSIIPLSEQAFGFLLATLLTLGTVALILSSSLGSILFGALVSVGAAASSVGMSSIPTLNLSLNALTQSAIRAAGSVSVLGNALRGLLITSGIGVVLVAFSFLATKALNASQNIDSATESLKEFRKVGRRMNRDNPYGPEPDIDDELRRYRSGGSSGMGSGQTIEVKDAEEFDTKMKNSQFRDWSNAQ